MPDEPAETLDRLFADYLDRLNAGETVDPLEVLYEQPQHGPALLEKLEAFVELTRESPEDRPLGTLGDYTLRRQIGRGGMGVVYEAWQNSMDRQVALKVLPAAVAADNKACMRFMREAKTAGQLHHHNIVSASTPWESTIALPYYAMEYVEGETLAQILAGRLKDAGARHGDIRSGKKTDQVVTSPGSPSAFAAVADGLQHAHSRGVIHRDISSPPT